MSNVIDFGEWKRARLGGVQPAYVSPPPRRRVGKSKTTRRPSDLSQQLLELLRHE
jgi:hypothetical protein